MLDLEQWISSEPTVVVRGRQLKVVSNKTVPVVGKKNGRYSDAAAAGSSAVLAFLVISAMIVTAICWYRKR